MPNHTTTILTYLTNFFLTLINSELIVILNNLDGKLPHNHLEASVSISVLIAVFSIPTFILYHFLAPYVYQLNLNTFLKKGILILYAITAIFLQGFAIAGHEVHIVFYFCLIPSILSILIFNYNKQ